MVRTVQAPRWTRSPSRSRTRRSVAISMPFTSVPFSEPGSRMAQVPSGSGIRTACRRETPGSVGGPVRSISGENPRLGLTRPMRIWSPVSSNRRSDQYSGNRRGAAAGTREASTPSKCARSAVTTADQVVAEGSFRLGAATGGAGTGLGRVGGAGGGGGSWLAPAGARGGRAEPGGLDAGRPETGGLDAGRPETGGLDAGRAGAVWL